MADGAFRLCIALRIAGRGEKRPVFRAFRGFRRHQQDRQPQHGRRLPPGNARLSVPAPSSGQADRRTRLVEPTETAEQHFFKWLQTHLFILDNLDGGKRAEKLSTEPALIAKIQPLIAQAIIATKAVRDPGATYNLFNWANSGGLVMDYLMSRLPAFDGAAERISIGPVSLSDLRTQFMISNTHLKRLLSQAAEMGSVGWDEPPRKGDLWLSRGFILEYRDYQAAKFAVVDAAAEAVLGPAI